MLKMGAGSLLTLAENNDIDRVLGGGYEQVAARVVAVDFFRVNQSFNGVGAAPAADETGAGADGLYFSPTHCDVAGEVWPDHPGRARSAHPQYLTQFH